MPLSSNPPSRIEVLSTQEPKEAPKPKLPGLMHSRTKVNFDDDNELMDTPPKERGLKRKATPKKSQLIINDEGLPMDANVRAATGYVNGLFDRIIPDDERIDDQGLTNLPHQQSDEIFEDENQPHLSDRASFNEMEYGHHSPGFAKNNYPDNSQIQQSMTDRANNVSDGIRRDGDMVLVNNDSFVAFSNHQRFGRTAAANSEHNSGAVHPNPNFQGKDSMGVISYRHS